MEQLSRNKKIAIFSLVVLSLMIVGLFFTGNLSFSGLKSDVLNQTCTEKGQQKKLSQYTASLNKRDQAQKTLDIVSGEIAVLNDKIESNTNTITEKRSQVEKKKANIVELSTFIEKSCKGRLANSARCREKIQQRKDLTQDVRILNNTILTLQNTNTQLARKIQNNQRVITQQLQLIARLNLFINQYEACDRFLKIKPVVTSPLMSGEANISGETLVSGEVTLIGKTLVSGEVLMSGEPCVSGEVRVPLYRFEVGVPYPAKAEIEAIDFNIEFLYPDNGGDAFKPTDWYITEENNPQLLYKCSFQDGDPSQMRCLPNVKAVVNSEARSYILSAMITSMTTPGSLEVQGANITYNGGKGDAVNQTTGIKINYVPKVVRTDIRLVSLFGAKGSLDGQFDYPRGVSVDLSGNVYVADSANNRIQKFDASGKFLMQFGTKGSADGQLNLPENIALDSSGNIYVADTMNNRIQKFDASGKFLMKFGTKGSADGQFYSTQDVTLDSAGNIYVVDWGNNRIQKFDASGKFLMKFGSYGNGDGQIWAPQNITLDSTGNIYISDTDNNRIQKFDASGKFLMKFGTKGSADGQFILPQGVSVDSTGNIYVVDWGNNRIQKFDASGKFLGRSTLYLNIWAPEAISIDSVGNIYLADSANNRIQKFREVIVCEKPSITVLSPNGWETFIPGQSNIISWKDGVNKVQIGLLDAKSTKENPIILGWIKLDGLPNGSTTWDGKSVMDLSGKYLMDIQPGVYKVVAVSANKDGNYCINNLGNCNADMSDSDFTIVSASQQTTIIPNQVTIDSNVNTTLIFTYPSNTTSATLYFTCPNGVSMGTSCNTNINVDGNGDWSPMFVNTTLQDQTVVAKYTTVSAGVSTIATANIIVRPAQTSTQPSVTVLSLNQPGLTFKIGDNLPLNAEVTGAMSSGDFSLYLTEKNSPDWQTGKYYWLRTGSGYDLTVQNPTQSGSVIIGSNFSSGKYYLLAQWKGLDGKSAFDFSDSLFEIVSGQVCPVFMPPPGGFCPNGVEVPGGTDAKGCPLPPTCALVAQCATSHYNCNKGAPEGQEESATEWNWACYVPEIGASSYVTCSEKKPLIDTTSPIITSLILPTTSGTTRVPLIMTVNETPVSYLMMDGPTPINGLIPALPPKPLSTDSRWLSTQPPYYYFTGTGSRTFFSWIKDAAGNVSDFRAAVVNILQCPAFSAPICKEGEEIVSQTGVDAKGCPLPPVCKPKIVMCPSVCTPLYELKNQCQLNTCGSGCGADNTNTFSSLDACKRAQII